jgi:hypothetical protein
VLTNALLAKAPALAAATTTVASATREQKKSLDAGQATNGTNKNTVGVDGATEEKKEKETKSRSQSRKRNSIFSSLLGKKEDKDEQKEVKKEEKEELKEEKKEEAKATHEPGAVAEPGVVAAAAAGKIFLFSLWSQLTITSSSGCYCR